MRPSLFQWGEFTLHSGEQSFFRIECDALSADDWCALGLLAVLVLPEFGRVEGVPRGGRPLAAFLSRYESVACETLLIVDDVWTSGASMEAQRAGREAIGLVVFARGPAPAWVTPLFTLTSSRRECGRDQGPGQSGGSGAGSSHS